MKLSLKYILSIIVLFTGAVAFVGCGNNEDGGDPEEDIATTDTKEEIVAVTRPQLVQVFLDVSGSMADYFGADIDTISAAITSLAQVPDSFRVEYYVWGNSKPIPRNQLIEKLLKKDLKGKASYFHEIFRPMAEMTNGDTLAVLITDGILSSASSKTKLSGKFTDFNKVTLANDIQKVFEGSDKALSMYRLSGQFNGNYWNKANKAVKYNGLRPFYVIALGNPANVRYFDQAARENNIHEVYTNAEALHIGTAPKNMTIRLYPTGEGNDKLADAVDIIRREGTDTYDYSSELGFRVGAELPKWLLDNYSPGVIESMSEVLVDNQVIPMNTIVENGHILFTVPGDVVSKKCTIGKPYTITYRMKDPAIGAWDAYSVDDDTEPDATTTYLLKNFVEAIRKGIMAKKTNLIEHSITIAPAQTEE